MSCRVRFSAALLVTLFRFAFGQTAVTAILVWTGVPATIRSLQIIKVGVPAPAFLFSWPMWWTGGWGRARSAPSLSRCSCRWTMRQFGLRRLLPLLSPPLLCRVSEDLVLDICIRDTIEEDILHYSGRIVHCFATHSRARLVPWPRVRAWKFVLAVDHQASLEC